MPMVIRHRAVNMTGGERPASADIFMLSKIRRLLIAHLVNYLVVYGVGYQHMTRQEPERERKGRKASTSVPPRLMPHLSE